MRPLSVALFLTLAGCPKSDTPADEAETDDTETTESDPQESDPQETDVAPTCSGEDLCTRSIDECEAEFTMETCLAFYDPLTTTCADIAAYEACNCDCITASDCGQYMGCGEICYSDHCQIE